MAATARRRILVTYSGDVDGEQQLDAAANTASPASVELVTLSGGGELGATNVTVDVPGGATAVTILKPSDNTAVIQMGRTDLGSGGITLHPTDPDSISIAPTVTEFTLRCVAAITLRLYWS